jgi:YD repeat-containing protein
MKIIKSIIPAFILIAILSVVVSCSGGSEKNEIKAGVEYYRSLQFSETPYDTEKGVHPLTEEEAKTINNYKFTYDDSGRLVSVEYNRNNILLGYSSMGAAKITYEYQDNKQIKRYFNKENEQVESGGVFAAEYTLDDRGNRTGLKFFGKDGTPVENRNKIHTWTWSILPDGMVKEQRFNLANVEVVMNPFCPFFELRFSYNEKGYITRMANYMGDTLYNCTAENCGDIGVSYFLFTPDDDGDLLKFEVFNVIGQMSNLYSGWSKFERKVDENGYALETAYFDQDNEYLGGKSVPVVQNAYDKHGAVIEVRNMDRDRNLMNDPESGVAIVEHKYDESGNRLETLRYDKDRVLVKE